MKVIEFILLFRVSKKEKYAGIGVCWTKEKAFSVRIIQLGVEQSVLTVTVIVTVRLEGVLVR